MKRIILYTGKGGVGKTTVAAATALKCSMLGYKTLVISTDPAHSLRDSFNKQLGPEPKKIADNLYGQEIDVYYSVEKYWGKLTEYLQSLLGWMNVNDILAEEFSVFPGMEEISSFLWVNNHYNEGNYDIIIVDSAPTGETLRLLSLPDVARWWLVKIFPIEKRVMKLIKPAVRVVTDMPLPEEKTYDAIEVLFEKLDAIRKIFADPTITSVRLVMNLENMVIKETQRAYTYLNLYGYPVDSLVINRTMPEELDHPYFKKWREKQLKYRKSVDEMFSPLPSFEVPLFSEEIQGINSLVEFSEKLYKNIDPTEIYFSEKQYEVVKNNGNFELHLKLPFVSKKDVELFQVADELVINLENQKRNIFLPNFLAKQSVKKASFDGGILKVVFEKKKS
jgi:arsenite/tail-anchored protein-transporting ATPase